MKLLQIAPNLIKIISKGSIVSDIVFESVNENTMASLTLKIFGNWLFAGYQLGGTVC